MTRREENNDRHSPDGAVQQHAQTDADHEFTRRFVTPPEMGPIGFEVITEGVADFWNFVTGRR